jgi:hypothetical protein
MKLLCLGLMLTLISCSTESTTFSDRPLQAGLVDFIASKHAACLEVWVR